MFAACVACASEEGQPIGGDVTLAIDGETIVPGFGAVIAAQSEPPKRAKELEKKVPAEPAPRTRPSATNAPPESPRPDKAKKGAVKQGVKGAEHKTPVNRPDQTPPEKPVEPPPPKN